MNLVKHVISDHETKEPLSHHILNLDSIAHASMSPEGAIMVTLQSGVTYDSTSANQQSRFMANLFWKHLDLVLLSNRPDSDKTEKVNPEVSASGQVKHELQGRTHEGQKEDRQASKKR